MRTPTSGTYLEGDDNRPYWREKHSRVKEAWLSLGKPRYFGYVNEQWAKYDRDEFTAYKNLLLEVYEVLENGTFYHHHGFRFLDWQKLLYTASQPVKIVIGGMSSGKSGAAQACFLTMAGCLNYFYGVAPAPFARQAREVHRAFADTIRNTVFAKSYEVTPFLSPEPGFRIRNGEVLDDGTPVESLILCIPFANPDSLKTFEFDAAYVEQFEMFPNITEGRDSVLAMVTSRLRGREKTFNRKRLGVSMWVANATLNGDVYAFADRALDEPDQYISIETDTEKNPYITDDQLKSFRSTFGRTQADIDYYFKGKRPLGDGEIFPASSIEACFTSKLDDLFTYAVSQKKRGYILDERQGVGLVRWAMPYDPEGKYLVVADPGWDNPPKRNSACIYVFRYDQFPERPAELYAFDWVFGDGKPEAWIDSFLRHVLDYNAINSCAYDATGWQAGYAHQEKRLHDVGAIEINMSAPIKNTALTVLRMIMSRGLLNMPKSLSPVINQLMNYVLPEPTKLRQDLVAGLMILATQLDVIYNTHVWKKIREAKNPSKKRKGRHDDDWVYRQSRNRFSR